MGLVGEDSAAPQQSITYDPDEGWKGDLRWVHSDRVLDSRESEGHKRQNLFLWEHCAFLQVIHLF